MERCGASCAGPAPAASLCRPARQAPLRAFRVINSRIPARQLLSECCQRATDLSRRCRHTANLPKPTARTLPCRASAEPSVLVPAAATRSAVKTKLLEAVQGTNRGIFGVQSAKAAEIEDLLEQLEAVTPLQNPTQHLEQAAGDWKLLYSTITILGKKRTKLGLREIISLGEFIQRIDVNNCKAVNEIQFNVSGMGFLNGKLTVTAEYSIATDQRVMIAYESSSLVPSQLQKLFEKNIDLLLSIFNPEGWLDITFVDEQHRIGRDDKGNVFLLERCT